jgi:hypothetical protein
MFEAQIAKGVEHLDQDLGKSWPEQVDLGILDLQGCTNCVIGQLYGDFDDTPDTFDAAPLGFDLPTAGLMQYEHYDVLTQEWKDKIAQLRAERANQC